MPACSLRPPERVRPRLPPDACRHGTVCSATRWRSTKARGSSACRSASRISAIGYIAQRAGPCTRRLWPNVSPGAAYFLDPDGYGWVYNPAGSYGPGRRPLPAENGLAITKGDAGDTAATERFCEEVLRHRVPAVALLWLSEPDYTGHHTPLG